MQIPHHVLNPDPRVYDSENFVTVDFEWDSPTGDPFHKDSTLVLAQWKHRSWSEPRVERANHYEITDLVRDIEQSDYVVAHQSIGDLWWLINGGWEGNRPIADTGVAEYVYYGNLPQGRMASLDDCLSRRGLPSKDSLVSKLIKGGVLPSEVPASWLSKYGAQDVLATESLWLRQREELSELGLLPTFYTRCLFLLPLMDIESRGMFLDSHRTKVVYTKLSQQLAELDQQLGELTGGINWNSGPQRADYLYDVLGFKVPKDNQGRTCVTDKGMRKTDKATMQLLRPKTKAQKQFLELYFVAKKIKDQLSKYIHKFHQCCEENEGLLEFRFNNTQTATHRLSSSGKHYTTQGQNLPNDFKPLFTARHEGWLVGEADESQLEYRVAVWLGNDEAGRKDIAAGADVHELTASVLFREDWRPEESSKSAHNNPLRNRAKASTFKPLYGGSSGTEREREYYQAFKDKHKGVTAYQDECFRAVVQDKELRIPTGLRFYWPDRKLTRTGRLGWPANSQVCDYPVQSIATADIVPIAVTYLWWDMKARNFEGFLVNTVHDSAVAEIPPYEAELWQELAAKHMTDTVYWYFRQVFNLELDVPLEAETKVSTHWSERPEWGEKWLNPTTV